MGGFERDIEIYLQRAGTSTPNHDDDMYHHGAKIPYFWLGTRGIRDATILTGSNQFSKMFFHDFERDIEICLYANKVRTPTLTV